MDSSDCFKKFMQDRVRVAGIGRFSIVGNKVPLKDIRKSFQRWAILNRELYQEPPKLTLDQLRKFCDDYFGKGQDDVYRNIIVFMDNDDAEDFDKSNHEDEEVLPAPAREIAESILSSKNPLELITGLIEDKRAWSSEIDSLEAEVEALRNCIAKKTEYTEKLLNKIALLYVSLPSQ